MKHIMSHGQRRRNPRRGNMPFAIIAVILLILSASYVAVTSQIEKSNENNENIGEELELIEKVMNKTQYFVERGLGEIIYSLSTKSTAGTLEQRMDTYKERADQWMKFQFPLVNRGVTVTLISHEDTLTTANFKISGTDPAAGCTPTYLMGTGKFNAKYSCDSGSSVAERTYETDASCALPLIAEQGSIFKMNVGMEGSIIHQMIAYQLAALAQYRVLNGYGAIAEYGPTGMMSILTEADATTAYTNALKMLALVDFRVPVDGVSITATHADLADFFVTNNGYADIDLSAAYSQALMSIADDVVLKLFDYFMGDALLQIVDGLGDILVSLTSFFGKKNSSAMPYISGILSKNGMSVDEYKRHWSGKTFSVPVSSAAVKSLVKDTKKTVSGFDANISYPNVNLASWPGIMNFDSKYRANNNDIKEWLTQVVNRAAVEIGSQKALGKISVRTDMEDSESFFGTITKAVRDTFTNKNSQIKRVACETVDSSKIIDPFYAAIFVEIRDNIDKIYKVDTFKSLISGQLTETLRSHVTKNYGACNDSKIPGVVSDLMNGAAVRNAMSAYKTSVDGLLNGFAKLNDVKGNQGGLMKDIFKGMIKTQLSYLETFGKVEKRVIEICEEYTKNIAVNPVSKGTALPGTDCFALSDSAGRNYVEKVTMNYKSAPKVTVRSPNNGGNNVHYVGLDDVTRASYCTQFTVLIKDVVEYRADSRGSVEQSMGVSDAAIEDKMDVDLTVKITVASGWALMGVNSYKPSTTIVDDAVRLLLNILGPLLDPLREVMKVITSVLEAVGNAIMEVAKFVAEVVEKLYNALMEPLEKLRKAIEDTLESWFSSALDSILGHIKTIMKIGLGEQTLGFSVLGFYVTVSFNAATLFGEAKHLLTLKMGCEIAGVKAEGQLSVHQRGGEGSKKLLLTGGAFLKGDKWSIIVKLDPLMKVTKHFLTVEGRAFGMIMDIVMPRLVQYKEIELSLSDIPGVGAMLSNIPLPLPGLKASFDAGLNLRYRTPFATGLVINEFEQNPAGSDRGREWVELYNASAETIELKGYKIVAGSNQKLKSHNITESSIGPGAKLLIQLPGSFLNNTGTVGSKAGEYVILKDNEDKEVDKTPKKKDNENDNRTWQRVSDGAKEWVFEEGTPELPNCGGLLNGTMAKTKMKKIMVDAAIATLSDMGSLENLKDVSAFIDKAVHKTIEKVIDMLADCLVEASIFISVDIGDAAGATCVGFRAALSIDSQFVEDGLKHLVGEIEHLLFNVGNPYGMSAKNILLNDVYLGMKIYIGMKTPKFLGNIDAYPEVKLCASIKCNLAGISRLVGGHEGKWKVEAGIMIADCPNALIPSGLGADRGLDSDLWLVQATFKQAGR